MDEHLRRRSLPSGILVQEADFPFFVTQGFAASVFFLHNSRGLPAGRLPAI
jgi:hypothetical protein